MHQPTTTHHTAPRVRFWFAEGSPARAAWLYAATVAASLLASTCSMPMGGA